MSILERPDLYHAADLFADSCRLSRQYTDAAAEALAKYGDHGPQISGCVREHFPENTKNYLRVLARNISLVSNAAYFARPARVRLTTMRALARAVAARDGSGFYGPQA